MSATLDGKRGLYKAFKDIPIQMCHFHQKKIVQRYITMRPKLDASKDLKKIVSRLTQTTEKNFTTKLDEWYEMYKDFLEEIEVIFLIILLYRNTFTTYRYNKYI